jgi:hypothetical protein
MGKDTPQGKKKYEKRMEEARLRKETREITRVSVQTKLKSLEVRKEKEMQSLQASAKKVQDIEDASQILIDKEQQINVAQQMEIDEKYAAAAQEYLSQPRSGPKKLGFRGLARKHGPGLDDKTLKRYDYGFLF